MALDTYANLKAAIEDWSHRNDVATKIDDFIDIAESEMNKHLRIREMEFRATSVPTSRFIVLPTSTSHGDFIKARRFKALSGGVSFDINYATPESMQVQNTTGRPLFFTVTSQIEFNRNPNGAYTVEMQYIAALNPLSTTNTTNDVLTKYPMIYLYGSLYALHQWARDEELAEYYFNKFIQAIQEANGEDRKGRYGPAPSIRVETSTP